MPDCDALYLAKYLIELGVTQGEHALTFLEIESWQRQIGIELQPWEVTALKNLSETYLGETHAARDPDAAAPWTNAPYLRSVKPKTGGLMGYIAGMK